MKRREVITLLGGAAAAPIVWPLAARAQKPERMRKRRPAWEAFLQALALSGWTIGRNLRVYIRWAAFNRSPCEKGAEELVALAPDVILAHANAPVGALRQATPTVPIVFPVAGDPVATGFVDSLVRPGGNITGFISVCRRGSIDHDNGIYSAYRATGP
jgi:ABC transporter substrate binding protein